MGRTAKYKKIKKTSVSSDGIWGLGYDGVKPKKRSRTAQKLRQAKLNRRLKRNHKHAAQEPDRGIDRAPLQDKDEFDLQDPQGSVRQQQVEKEQAIVELPLVKKSPSVAAAMDRKEIQEATQLLNATASGDKPPKYEGRREHESKNAYQRRVKEETRHIIKQTKLKELNPEKRQRKKEFLKQKKKKGKRTAQQYDEDYDRIPVDDVPFGHQVERPPEFKSLPRGAAALQSSKQKKKKTTMKTDQEVQAEQENLEKMRQKVQEQYALIKAKRKRAGDFHL